MKTKCILPVISLVLATAAQATLFEYSFTGINQVIPDNNVNGWSDARNITASTVTISNTTMGLQYDKITDVNVKLNISGGYNGDLYGTLTHSSGFSVLLNRVGRTGGLPNGYADSGFNNITLNDTALKDIHVYGGGFVPQGGWKPDGRNVDPTTVTTADPRTALLSSFNNLDPHGTWTLFFADYNGNLQTSTLVSWGLQITAVPEPITWALVIFGGVVGGIQTVRRLAIRKSA